MGSGKTDFCGSFYKLKFPFVPVSGFLTVNLLHFVCGFLHPLCSFNFPSLVDSEEHAG